MEMGHAPWTLNQILNQQRKPLRSRVQLLMDWMLSERWVNRPDVLSMIMWWRWVIGSVVTRLPTRSVSNDPMRPTIWTAWLPTGCWTSNTGGSLAARGPVQGAPRSSTVEHTTR